MKIILFSLHHIQQKECGKKTQLGLL